jgi:mannose-1-phosphate guanylyltransferase
MYAVILAGGSGKRLWPLSRRESPKQLLDITHSKQSLLQETFTRLQPLVPFDNVFVITARQYVESTRERLPSLPSENVISEPEGRGSAPAIGLAALHIWCKDPEAVMACLPADHHITEPHTGYGYIELGQRLNDVYDHAVYSVARFTEKPDEETAARFVQGGRHLWNSGMFIWKASVFLEEVARHLPRLDDCLSQLGCVLGTEEENELLERLWPQVEKETIDFGIMEKADDVVVMPVGMGWSDVGSWASLMELLPADGDGNVVVGDHLGLETRGSLIYSPGRLVATLGVENLIVVETEDAILVCPRDRAQEVKRLVERLEQEGWQRCL